MNNTIERLNNKQNKVENTLTLEYKRKTGTYYTDMLLTDKLMQELVEYLQTQYSIDEIVNKRLLEPCVGMGSYIFSYLKAINNLNITKQQAEKLLENIYVADINVEVLIQYKENLKELVKTFWNIELKEEYFKKHIGSGLIIDVISENPEYIPISKAFKQNNLENTFDIIITNPPYKQLRNTKWTKHKQANYDIIKGILTPKYKYASESILDLYKIFTEEIISKYATNGAIISLLIPMTILTNFTNTRLRTHLINDNKILDIKQIENPKGIVKANVPLASILFKKGGTTSKFTITKNYPINTEKIEMDIDEIKNEKQGNKIYPLTREEFEIKSKMEKFKTLGEFSGIEVYQGEYKTYGIESKVKTEKYNRIVLNGRNIVKYGVDLENDLEGYTSEENLKKLRKYKHINQTRIACRQIANINIKSRFFFAKIENGEVLRNTTNYIISNGETSLDYLLAVLNTKIIEWYYNLHNSDKHITAESLKHLPIPDEDLEITLLSKEYQKEHRQEILDDIEEKVRKNYGIEGKNK